MLVRGAAVALLLVMTVLAGCGGGGGTSLVESTITKQALAANKGAIAGLLIDDVYRPIPAGKLLLLPIGLTTTSDQLGQFGFVDLDPGTYTVKVDSEGHEAAPQSIDVKVGEYSEMELSARRISSLNGRIITLQTSVFIPCSVSSPVITVTVGCLGDTSGDSYRTGFTTNFNGTAVTYLVAEAKFGDPDNYDFVLRPTTSSSIGDAFNDTTIYGKTYARLVIKANGTDYQRNNWDPDEDLQATVFYAGQTDCLEPVDECDGFGTGAKLAMKATMLLSAFVGEPIADVKTYQVLEGDA